LAEIIEGGTKFRETPGFSHSIALIRSALEDFVAHRHAVRPLTDGELIRLQSWVLEVVQEAERLLPQDNANLHVWKHAIHKLHKHFVVVPIDKAQQTFGCVCGQFYARTRESMARRFTEVPDRSVLPPVFELFESTACELNILGESNSLVPYLWISPKLHKGIGVEGWRSIVGSPFNEDEGRSTNYTALVARRTSQLVNALLTDLAEINSVLQTTDPRSISRFFVITNTQEFSKNIEPFHTWMESKDMTCTDLSECYTNMNQSDVYAAVEWAYTKIQEYHHQLLRDTNADLDEEIPAPRLMPGYGQQYNGHKWDLDEGYTLQEVLRMVRLCTTEQYFECNSHLFKQNKGISIGAYAAAGLVNITLAHKEWTWIETHETDLAWANCALEQRRLIPVFRFMDDRWAPSLSAHLLPSEEHYGIRFSSRQEGREVDFIGWHIDSREKVSITYSDKQAKMPDVLITRFPLKSSVVSSFTISGCIVGRLTQIRRGTAYTDGTDFHLFFEGAKTILSQIASRGYTYNDIKASFDRVARDLITPHLRPKVIRTLTQIWNELESDVLLQRKERIPSIGTMYSFPNTSNTTCAMNTSLQFIIYLLRHSCIDKYTRDSQPAYEIFSMVLSRADNDLVAYRNKHLGGDAHPTSYDVGTVASHFIGKLNTAVRRSHYTMLSYVVNVEHKCPTCNTIRQNRILDATFIEATVHANVTNIVDIDPMTAWMQQHAKLSCQLQHPPSECTMSWELISPPQFVFITVPRVIEASPGRPSAVRTYTAHHLSSVKLFDLDYELVWVVLHHGANDPNSGHFTCFILDDEAGWLHLNDNKVRSAKKDEVLFSNKSALLAYRCKNFSDTYHNYSHRLSEIASLDEMLIAVPDTDAQREIPAPTSTTQHQDNIPFSNPQPEMSEIPIPMNEEGIAESQQLPNPEPATPNPYDDDSPPRMTRTASPHRDNTSPPQVTRTASLTPSNDHTTDFIPNILPLSSPVPGLDPSIPIPDLHPSSPIPTLNHSNHTLDSASPTPAGPGGTLGEQPNSIAERVKQRHASSKPLLMGSGTNNRLKQTPQNQPHINRNIVMTKPLISTPNMITPQNGKNHAGNNHQTGPEPRRGCLSSSGSDPSAPSHFRSAALPCAPQGPARGLPRSPRSRNVRPSSAAVNKGGRNPHLPQLSTPKTSVGAPLGQGTPLADRRKATHKASVPSGGVRHRQPVAERRRRHRGTPVSRLAMSSGSALTTHGDDVPDAPPSSAWPPDGQSPNRPSTPDGGRP
jgi:hypothetical protein